ncbi:MAG TPA: integrase core domain-containing protein [Acidimicrobiia bacterium]|nr:integrase core domain-containing protein [Acidimicrobiia bacterium]
MIARLVVRATAWPVCDALMDGRARDGMPEQILADNAKVFTGRLANKPAVVLFDRICLNYGICHLLTAPYSTTTTGKIERLHKTLRKEFFSQQMFDTIEEAQVGLDYWVEHYNRVWEHQGIGDVPPIRGFALAALTVFEAIDGDVEISEEPPPKPNLVIRRVDAGGRISILKHRYHVVGRYLAGRAVTVESSDGLLHVSHNGVVVATQAPKGRHRATIGARRDVGGAHGCGASGTLGLVQGPTSLATGKARNALRRTGGCRSFCGHRASA